MKRKPRLRLFRVAFAIAVALSATAAQTVTNDAATLEWNFDVFIDDKRIGYHNFELTRANDEQRVTSVADFKVKVLFLTLYKYQHENTETWLGECLQRIESRTNANGKKFAVRGAQESDAFVVDTTESRDELSGCVKTFAYWDADFLSETKLLNAQTGEILPVTVEAPAEEAYTVRGQDVAAQRYRLRAENLDLDLWYSQDGEWLGLRSTTKDGRKIRYQLN